MPWSPPQTCSGACEAAEGLTSTGFPAPPVSKLDFPIYKPRPGTELISIQHKQEASRNQQDSPGTQLLSQKVQYFILFYPEWVKGWVTFLFHCSREEDLAKEAMRKPKSKTLQYTNLCFTILFLSWAPNWTDAPRRVTSMSPHMFGWALTLLSFYSCGLSAQTQGNIRQWGAASSSDGLTSKVGWEGWHFHRALLDSRHLQQTCTGKKSDFLTFSNQSVFRNKAGTIARFWEGLTLEWVQQTPFSLVFFLW